MNADAEGLGRVVRDRNRTELSFTDNIRRWGLNRHALRGANPRLHAGVAGLGWVDPRQYDPSEGLALHPGHSRTSHIVANALVPGPTPELLMIRESGLAFIEQMMPWIASRPGATDDELHHILGIAFGPDEASLAVRQAVVPDLTPPLPTPEHLPLVINPWSEDELLWAGIFEALRAMADLGDALQEYADWVARAVAHAEGIAALEPPKGCAGQSVSIRGRRFGRTQPDNRIVMFPGKAGKCWPAVVTRWRPRTITVVVPEEVGIGAVGFVDTDGPEPAGTALAFANAQGAASALAAVLGNSIGMRGVSFSQKAAEIPGVLTPPPLPCPPLLPKGGGGTASNLFTGGPPLIDSFLVNGRQTISVHPGEAPSIAWNVTNATRIEILQVSPGSVPLGHTEARLPTLPADLETSGSFQLPPLDPEAVYDWDGVYELNAHNDCTGENPKRATVNIRLREFEPLFGIADTHTHFMAHLAFAGHGIYGRVHARSPQTPPEVAIAEALPWCSTPSFSHGPGGIDVNLEFEGPLSGHLVGGFPQFDGWPRHTTLSHQQAYIDWIRRAVDGGLRLAVVHAVNSELLSKSMLDLPWNEKLLPADDMSSVVLQLEAVHEMVDFVDQQCGGPGRGWMQVARSPAEARSIVSQEKLALVLGVEVDSLGGWHTAGQLDRDAAAQGVHPEVLIESMVARLYDRGVRHFFPIHGTNNAFGGAGLFVRNYDATNYLASGGHSFEVASAPGESRVKYRLDVDTFTGGSIAELIAYYGVSHVFNVGAMTMGGFAQGLVFGLGSPTASIMFAAEAFENATRVPPKPTNWSRVRGGHINSQGLTTHGRFLLKALMRRACLIDVDHMGWHSFHETLERCQDFDYPVIAGHTSLSALKLGWESSLELGPATADAMGTRNARSTPTEVDKSPDQIRAIRDSGGMVSIFTYQKDIRSSQGGVRNDCPGTSASFAQALLHVHALMNGRGIGIGTDINGAGQLPGPRFGPGSAPAIKKPEDSESRRLRGEPSRRSCALAQSSGVKYSSPLRDYRHHRFMEYSDDPYHAPFDAERRDFCEAIAIWRSGTPPEAAEQPGVRTMATVSFIINLATGLRAARRTDIPLGLRPEMGQLGVYVGANADEQLAAHLASHDLPFADDDSERVRSLVRKLRPIWRHWQEMERGGVVLGPASLLADHIGPFGRRLYNSQGELERSVAGRRDFDVNLDGMAHYGLLPDFMQDLSNVGVSSEALGSLYRSAEDYIRMWERCERRASRVD